MRRELSIENALCEDVVTSSFPEKGWELINSLGEARGITLYKTSQVPKIGVLVLKIPFSGKGLNSKNPSSPGY